VSVIAFHEKAGRSQVEFFFGLVGQVFFPPELALSPTIHPHNRGAISSSLGASFAISFKPVLPPVYRPRFHLEDENWARRLTQSPELGLGF
jgi:hypothetical protein